MSEGLVTYTIDHIYNNYYHAKYPQSCIYVHYYTYDKQFMQLHLNQHGSLFLLLH